VLTGFRAPPAVTGTRFAIHRLIMEHHVCLAIDCGGVLAVVGLMFAIEFDVPLRRRDAFAVFSSVAISTPGGQ
jgi:hypothetical protein